MSEYVAPGEFEKFKIKTSKIIKNFIDRISSFLFKLHEPKQLRIYYAFLLVEKYLWEII